MNITVLVFGLLILALTCPLTTVFAQNPVDLAQAADAKDKTKDKKGKDKTAEQVLSPAWVKVLPKVSGKSEQRYDINRDGILQTSETKIFFRDIIDEVNGKGSVNVSDSVLLKSYDKNKDGIISKLELEDIKKDLNY